MSVDSLSCSCFNPIVTINPRYRKDAYSDFRFRRLGPQMYSDWYLKVPCGKCFLCRKRKGNSWRVRLLEELKDTPQFYHEGRLKYRAIFVLFTFSDKYVTDDRKKIAEYIRKWRDLWRKTFGRSPRYFLTTDRGSQFARYHLHLIIFNPYDYKQGKYWDLESYKLVDFFWRYGHIGYNCSWITGGQAVTYVTSYISGGNLSKDDEVTKHGKPVCKDALEYVPHIFVSRGLGAGFIERNKATYNYLDIWTYNIGIFEYGLPVYYRNKIFDAYDRFMKNQILKEEEHQYILDVGRNYKYSLFGSLWTLESLKQLYFNMYAKFDKTPKLNINNG